jgi:hypothetical protein
MRSSAATAKVTTAGRCSGPNLKADSKEREKAMTASDVVHPIHFVGSIPLADAESVFRTLAESVGDLAPRWPDGETGDRGYWIRWQKQTFDTHPDFVLKALFEGGPGYKDTLERPFYVIREGVDPANVVIETMGYAAAALSSYAVFEKLKADGVIPDSVRFQVSIPSTVALTTGFFEIPERAMAEPIIEAALAREVETIAAAIPHDQLAIQWDVCHEVVGADGGMPLHYDDIVAGSVNRIARHLGYIPAAAEAGIHLCYGDPGHKHIIEPADLGTCVAYANGIAAASPRRVDFIHMPVPRDRRDDAYFAPLDRLDLPPETMLFLGLVHFTDGADGTNNRLAAAASHAAAFGIATECGFGRRDPETIPRLLGIHADISGA